MSYRRDSACSKKKILLAETNNCSVASALAAAILMSLKNIAFFKKEVEGTDSENCREFAAKFCWKALVWGRPVPDDFLNGLLLAPCFAVSLPLLERPIKRLSCQTRKKQRDSSLCETQTVAEEGFRLVTRYCTSSLTFSSKSANSAVIGLSILRSRGVIIF